MLLYSTKLLPPCSTQKTTEQTRLMAIDPPTVSAQHIWTHLESFSLFWASPTCNAKVKPGRHICTNQHPFDPIKFILHQHTKKCTWVATNTSLCISICRFHWCMSEQDHTSWIFKWTLPWETMQASAVSSPHSLAIKPKICRVWPIIRRFLQPLQNNSQLICSYLMATIDQTRMNTQANVLLHGFQNTVI